MRQPLNFHVILLRSQTPLLQEREQFLVAKRILDRLTFGSDFSRAFELAAEIVVMDLVRRRVCRLAETLKRFFVGQIAQRGLELHRDGGLVDHVPNLHALNVEVDDAQVARLRVAVVAFGQEMPDPPVGQGHVVRRGG